MWKDISYFFNHNVPQPFKNVNYFSIGLLFTKNYSCFPKVNRLDVITEIIFTDDGT